MELLKTFYSKNGKGRCSINRRPDGLYNIFAEEVTLEYYHEDDSDELIPLYYYWEGDLDSSITDSFDIIEKWCKDDGLIEAPLVDEFDYVQLKNGMTCTLLELLEDGRYLFSVLNPAEVQQIINRHEYLAEDGIVSVFDVEKVIPGSCIEEK